MPSCWTPELVSVTSYDTDIGRLRAVAVASALLAQVLGPDIAALIDPEIDRALRAALAAAGADGALRRLEAVEDPGVPADPAELAGRWVRWFDLGRVAPYEASNVVASAGGVTPRLADIAGFYRAFGLEVADDRPDHVIAELEFLAMAVMAEAEANDAGDNEAAGVAAGAIRLFIRDHIGAWIDAWASRVAGVDELRPWVPAATAAVELVRAEATRRNVIPLSDAAVLLADAGVADDEEAVLDCLDSSAD